MTEQRSSQSGCPILEGLMQVRLTASDEDHAAIDAAVAEIQRLRAAAPVDFFARYDVMVKESQRQAREAAEAGRKCGQMKQALVALVNEVETLIGESHGVTGLHMNGDVAPWTDLEPGGAFERLGSLTTARELIGPAAVVPKTLA